MNRKTAKQLRMTAKATGAPYRGLKAQFKKLSQKAKCTARREMTQTFKKKAAQ